MEIALSIAGLIVGILAILYHRWREYKKARRFFKVIWKKSSALLPAEVLDLRAKPKFGYNKYYFPRDEAQAIKARIQEGEHVLVTGSPLAGKTRTVYQTLLALDKPYFVCIPHLADVNPQDFQIPKRKWSRRKRILLLDDIDKFFEKQNFQVLFDKFLKDENAIIVATCRSGPEYKLLQKKNERELEAFDKPIPIDKISPEQGKMIAGEAKTEFPPQFDGNIGSIFVRLETMRSRYQDLDGKHKAILRAIKRLFMAGIYTGKQEFSIARVKRVCEKIEGITETREFAWTEMLNKLRDQGFIEKDNDILQTEEAYLELVIEDVGPQLENLKDMFEIFRDDADAALKIGNRSHGIGLIDIHRRHYDKLAIEAYSAALKVYTLADFPMDYGMTQNNLGNAYRTLAEVENKAANCHRAIKVFIEALKFYTLADSPIQYGTTQNNLGSAYGTLAEVEDKAENCRYAITAYQEALKVRTLADFPMQYGATQNNLGTAYKTLAEVENKAENCHQAIKAFNEALKIRTLADSPIQYGMTQNNLGAACGTLADIENKAENCQRAITAYQEALKVRTPADFPMDYGMTQNNLGNDYRKLAEVEDKAKNCRRAIKAFNEALKVYTLADFPMQYGTTQNNLGTAYSRLAEVENKAENCCRAIKAFSEAWKVYTLADFPMQYGTTQNNLGTAYWTLAEVENKAENCRRARIAYEEALMVFTAELPVPHKLVMENLESLSAFCENE